MGAAPYTLYQKRAALPEPQNNRIFGLFGGGGNGNLQAGVAGAAVGAGLHYSQLQHSTPAPGTEEQTTGSWGTSRSRVDSWGPWLASLRQKRSIMLKEDLAEDDSIIL